MNTPAPRPYRQTTRAAAAAETGRRITSAFLARLSEQWYDEITLDQIAEDAGVTVQTIVRRFGGKAGLLASAIEEMKGAAKKRRAATPGDLEQIVRSLIDDYEAMGDTLIRLLALEERHPILHEHLTLARGWHRQWLSEVLAGAFMHLRPLDRNSAIDAIVVATDVYAWKLLRRDLGRSVMAVRRTLESLIRSTIALYSS